MARSRGAVLALVVALCGPEASFAQGEASPAGMADLSALPLDALLDLEVTGASKFAQRASESAASVTVISAAEIRAFGYRTLGDVLRSVRGLHTSGDRSYSYLGVRGFAAPGDYNTRVLLLIDGNRVNDTVYGQAPTGTEFPLDVGLIERVEFIPGQGSSVYGANALFGVINVITRQPAAGSTGVALAAGSGRSREAQLGLSRELPGGTRLQVSASRHLSAGEALFAPLQAVPPDNDGYSRDTDYERRSSLYLRADQGPVTLTLLHADRIKGAPATLDLAFGDPRNFNRDSRSLLDATLRQDLPEATQMTARVFVGRYRFDGQYVYPDADAALNRDRSVGEWWGAEARWFTTRWLHHKTVAGLEVEREGRVSQRNHDLDAAETVYLDDNRSGHRAALYAEDQFELSPDWTLTAGGRYDLNSDGLRRFSPRVALNYRPREDLVLKLIHGTAYRQPNAYEAHYVSDAVGGYRSNPALRPETVRGSELALEWRPDATSRFSGSLYENKADKLIALTYDAADQRYIFRNAQPARTQGLELEYERIWQGGARLRGNLSLQRTRDSGGLQVASDAPARLAKLMAMAPLSDDWTLGAEWQAVASRGAAGGYGVVHATLSRYFGHQGTTLSLSLYDLLDRRYDDPGADVQRQPTIAQVGRAWRARLEWAF